MANMIPISTVTVGSGGASTIEFNNIPQIYTDLQVSFSCRTTQTANWTVIYLRPNGSSSNGSTRQLYGTGSGTGSETDTVIYAGSGQGTDTTSNTFSNGSIYIPNYTSSNNKSISSDSVTENNATAALARFVAGLWSNTSPITSLTLVPSSGSFVQYSSATLYGIRKY